MKKNKNKWKVCVQHKQHSRKLYNRQTFLVYVLCLEFTAWRAGVNSPAATSRFQGKGRRGRDQYVSKANHFHLLINSGNITWNKGTLIILDTKCLLIFFPMDLFALIHLKRYDLSIGLRTLWLWFAFSLMVTASSSEIFYFVLTRMC